MNKKSGPRLLALGPLVVQNLAGLEKNGLTLKEYMRVVAPYGVAFVEMGDPEAIKQQLAQAKIAATVSAQGGWVKIVKSYPKEMDEWTRYGHDETMSGHTLDTLVGPPSSVRWINWVNGEYWGDQGPFPGSDLVSANGRTFHYHDLEKRPRDVHIVARDAFNGIELWKIPALPPPVMGLGMFHANGRIYTMNTAEFPNTLVALDEATGKVVQKYDNLSSKMIKKEQRKNIHYGMRHYWGYESGVIFIQPDYTHLVVYDEKTGKQLWEAEIPDDNAWPKGRYLFQLPAEAKGPAGFDIAKKGEYFTTYFATHQGVYFIESNDILTCRDLHTGKALWKTTTQVKKEALFFMAEGRIFTLSDSGQNPKGILRAYSQADGRYLWCCDYLYGRDRNMAVYNGQLWMAMLDGHHKSTAKGVDLETGKEIKTVDLSAEFEGCVWHCFPTVTTPKGMITSGCHFFDPRETKVSSVPAAGRFVRPACNIGIIPANGLIYQNLNACTCEQFVRGVVAYASEPAPKTDGKEPWRLVRGDAAAVADNPVAATDWPTYRHDMARSGLTPIHLPENLTQKWSAVLPDRTFQPVVAGERVYATLTEAHTVYALAANDGRVLWRFIASSRIDSSPTYESGRLVFGDNDGDVYCLNAVNGALLWRFQAAPVAKRITVRDQLESAWPVSGSLVVRKGMVYAIAGRNNHMDGGLLLYGLDLKTGAVTSFSKLESLAEFSVNKDIVIDDGKNFLFDTALVDPAKGKLVTYCKRSTQMKFPFLMAGCVGFTLEPRITDGARYDTYRRHQHFGKLHGDVMIGEGKEAWGFFSDAPDNGNKQLKQMGFQGGEKSGQEGQKGSKGYDNWLIHDGVSPWNIRPVTDKWGPKSMVTAMVKAGDALYVGIQTDVTDPKVGLLQKYSADKGTLLGSVSLDCAPRFDSMVIAGQSIYIGTEDHRLICLGGK